MMCMLQLLFHTLYRLKWGEFLNVRSRMAVLLIFFMVIMLARRLIFKVFEKNDNLKYILLWTRPDWNPFPFLEYQQRAFVRHNCSVQNCYVTGNILHFNGDIKWYDAVLFNGRNLFHPPPFRGSKQLYVYVNTEAVENSPVCSPQFDNFYNLTATYRLDSDIPFPYLTIRNSTGDIVGPKTEMNWIKDMKETDKEITDKLLNKTKAAAWYISDCNAKRKRAAFLEKLRSALNNLGLNVDIYGKCGTFNCTLKRTKTGKFLNGNSDGCIDIFSREYFFYLAFESSLSNDYVTVQLLLALESNTVPVVFGGANYSRFMPPGSYLDSRDHSPEELAKKMHQLIHSRDLYMKFFNWKPYYTYESGVSAFICSLCERLNKETKIHSSYAKFRSWWNPDYTKFCGST